MGFKIYGIAATQAKDRRGETIEIDGIHLAASYIIDEHIPGCLTTVGSITKVKKVLKEKDAETPREKQCWELVKGPFVYFEGELADGEDHPDAVAAAALIKFANARPELPFKIGASIEGATLRRGSKDKESPDHKRITLAIMEGVAITCRPCNPECAIFPWNSLEKADYDMPLPQEALDRILFAAADKPSIRQSQERAQMNVLRQEVKRMLDLFKQLTPETLQKSLDDWNKGGMCTMKCSRCGEAERLFKSSTNFRNRCTRCGNAFTMEQFWNAMNS
jgi:hypothetical protein